MKCVLLCAPGEILEGEREWASLGYEVVAYPATQDISLLRDDRDEEFAPFLGARPEACDRPYVRSLRASFIRMLTDPAFANDDLVLFGESDATPTVRAEVLKPRLQTLLAAHPEADVIRLFHELARTPESISLQEDIAFEPYTTGTRTRVVPYVWGTHALVIPVAKRQKIADLFASCRLPTDTCLEAAQSNGEIEVLVACRNLVYQKPRTHAFDARASYSWRKRRIAACLSSCGRLHDAQRQILLFMDQSYAEFHLFVAVKGITEYVFRKILEPACRKYIDAGRLTLRLFPNKNQLANLMDTVRGLDISGYELFAKIDDDDFYHPDYLATVNEFHCEIPQHHGSFFHDVGLVLDREQGFPCARQEVFDMFGPSLVLTRRQWELARGCEENSERIAEFCGAESRRVDWTFREDRLLHAIMRREGCSNIAPFVEKRDIYPFLAVEKGNASVTRGGLVPTGMERRPKDAHQYLVELDHPDWHDTLSLIGREGKRLATGARAETLKFDDATIVLRWGDEITELFIKNSEGFYRFQKKV